MGRMNMINPINFSFICNTALTKHIIVNQIHIILLKATEKCITDIIRTSTKQFL